MKKKWRRFYKDSAQIKRQKRDTQIIMASQGKLKSFEEFKEFMEKKRKEINEKTNSYN